MLDYNMTPQTAQSLTAAMPPQEVPKAPPPDFRRAYTGATADAVMAPAPPVAANPLQVPVPTHEDLGLPAPDRRTYTEIMDQKNGPIPPPQKFVEDWRTPESRQAAQAFRYALLANFSSAAAGGENSLSLFFQSNPYAYMLGQSMEDVESQIQALAAKNGGTDRAAAEYSDMTTILDAAQLITGNTRQRLTGSPGVEPERWKYLTGDFTQSLNAKAKNNPRGFQVLMNNAAGMIGTDKELATAIANLKNSDTERMRAITDQKRLQLERDTFEKYTLALGQSQIKLNQAQAAELLARKAETDAKLGYAPATAEANVKYLLAQTSLMNAQATNIPIETSLRGLDQQQREAANRMQAMSGISGSYWQQYYAADTKVREMESSGRYQTARADGTLEDNTDLFNAKQERDRYRELYNKAAGREQSEANAYIQNAGVNPSAKALGMTMWLPLATSTGIYKWDQLANAMSDPSRGDMGVYKDLLFPPRPMVWDQANVTFRPDTSIDPGSALGAQASQNFYDYLRDNPDKMNEVRAGKYMSYGDWKAFIASSNAANKTNLTPQQYIGYVSLCNYVKQNDFLLDSYQKALTAHQDIYQYGATHSLMAPGLKPLPTPTSLGIKPRKGGK